jgi:hypothetical protein
MVVVSAAGSMVFLLPSNWLLAFAGFILLCTALRRRKPARR